MLSVGQTVMCLRRDVYPAGKIRGHLFFARNDRTEVIFDFVKVIFRLASKLRSFLTFVLLYTPCVATVATMRKELGSVWKTAVVVVYQCALAWVCSCIVYQIAAAC